ncbi:uncharacterized protein LOC124843839 [Vigna umbellata]|uniref:uncharacterized protein LOC124843839 n=1 Tax=Vigna umbellata TaxID=87088 RepID=UPI001F5F56F6|nr:uncharacterized protein LOC124843839 [Vigna umbellata]
MYLLTSPVNISTAVNAVDTFRNHLFGTLQLLMNNILSCDADILTLCFSAFQQWLPSGSFRDAMNIGAMVMDRSSFPILEKIWIIRYCDLVGENLVRKRKHCRAKEDEELSSESYKNSYERGGRGVIDAVVMGGNCDEW